MAPRPPRPEQVQRIIRLVQEAQVQVDKYTDDLEDDDVIRIAGSFTFQNTIRRNMRMIGEIVRDSFMPEFRDLTGREYPSYDTPWERMITDVEANTRDTDALNATEISYYNLGNSLVMEDPEERQRLKDGCRNRLVCIGSIQQRLRTTFIDDLILVLEGKPTKAKIAREKAARENEAKERAAKEVEAKEKAAREKKAKEQEASDQGVGEEPLTSKAEKNKTGKTKTTKTKTTKTKTTKDKKAKEGGAKKSNAGTTKNSKKAGDGAEAENEEKAGVVEAKTVKGLSREMPPKINGVRQFHQHEWGVKVPDPTREDYFTQACATCGMENEIIEFSISD